MRRWIAGVIALIMVLAMVALPVNASPAAIIEQDFDRIAQGRIGVIRISGASIRQVRAAFLEHQYLFVQDGSGDYLGYIAAPMDSEPGTYRLSLLIRYEDGSEDYQALDIEIGHGNFERVDLMLPPQMRDLLAADIALDEYALLDSHINHLTDGGAWLASGFMTPLNRPISAHYGTFRRYNGSVWQRHTGIDYPAPEGSPIFASASGRVVYHGFLPIRGQYVLIDHSAGVFTGYAHLSQAYVQMGDPVAQGDIIGAAGNTGRSTGTHLHWEMAISGVWVNPLEMQRLLSESTP